MHLPVAFAGVCALVSVVPCASAVSAQYAFTVVSPPGSAGLNPPLLINDGGLIAGSYKTDTDNVGFVLSGGTYTAIEPPGSTAVQVTGINNAGQIVGSCFIGDNEVAFTWQNGVYQILQIPTATATAGLAINEAGEVVLQGDVLQKKHHYTFFSAVYKDGVYTMLNVNDLHRPTFIDDSGTLFGSPQHFKPDVFKFIPGGKIVKLNKDFPHAKEALISQVSPGGLLAGFYQAGNTAYGFTLTGNSLTTYSAPNSTKSTVLGAVSSNGLVAGYADHAGDYAGFVAQGSSYTFLEIPGETVPFVPSGINASGTVVGQLGRAPNTAYIGTPK